MRGGVPCDGEMRENVEMQFIDLKAQYRKLKSDIDARIQAVLDHGQYILGPEVAELERQLAAFVGVKHCISVASGTARLAECGGFLWMGSIPNDLYVIEIATFSKCAQSLKMRRALPERNISVALVR